MKIEEILGQLKNRGKKGLIIYITAGDPNLETTEELVCNIAEAVKPIRAIPPIGIGCKIRPTIVAVNTAS